MYCYFGPRTTQFRDLVVSVSDRFDSPVGTYCRLFVFVFFFFFFFRLVMQNYFIQVIWNYINDKNYAP